MQASLLGLSYEDPQATRVQELQQAASVGFVRLMIRSCPIAQSHDERLRHRTRAIYPMDPMIDDHAPAPSSPAVTSTPAWPLMSAKLDRDTESNI